MKLSICVDMGAKNNGVFIVKTDGKDIVDKKALTVVIDKNSINFSKKSRRENRHRVRSYARRKLAKRFLWQFLDKEKFSKEEIEQINGLLNNRGYTFLSTSSEFEELQEETITFLNEYISELKDLKTKEDFEAYISEFDLEELENFIKEVTSKIDEERVKKKSEFYKEYKEYHQVIKKDLKLIKDFFNDILKEIKTGAKPREKYLQEIKDEIQKYDFIKDKNSFYNLIGNISNLQLRILRKFFDNAIRKKDNYKLIKDYFNFFHWNYNDKEKEQRKKLFDELNRYDNLEEFLKNCDPQLTIPPYEDMNNRNTYKCNSLLINPKYITKSIKNSIDILSKQPQFEVLNLKELENAKKLQRILDINLSIIDKKIHPREVFYHNRGDIGYYQKLLGKDFEEFSSFAKEYYSLEKKALTGIYKDGLLVKCGKNTPSKNNFKHILLKPLYEYDFTKDEVEKFLEGIKNTKGLQTHLKKISEVAKEYQNAFYHYVEACFENDKCLNDKSLKDIVKNLKTDKNSLQKILNDMGIKSYLDEIENVDKTNLKRVLNIFKQTYEILFKDINGFSKTCKECTIENNIRSIGNEAIAKRLLSDVAKPIDGILDFMLDRLAWEIVEKVDDLEEDVEIVLEQNRFLFENNLASIKGKSLKKRESKDLLNLNICPYTGENITDTNGEYDHILPQSKELFNSKANLIYCSRKGNLEKSNKRYFLENLSIKHLKEIFKSDDLNQIKEKIRDGLKNIDKEKYTNFDNLSLNQQIALRYALFMEEDTEEFKKAKSIIEQDRIKTFSNGTQKRLARLIYEKLHKKFKKDFNCKVQVVDSLLVNATRKYLSYDKTTGEINELWKEEKQDSHSHAIDAMVAFYLANATIKGRHHKKRENIASIDPEYDFSAIYIKNSDVLNVKKRKTFINAEDIGSYKLFQDTLYKENYHHIAKDFKNIDLLIEKGLLYKNKNNKKYFIENIDELEENVIYKIDVDKTSKLLFDLFKQKNKDILKRLKFLDKLRFKTTRVDILKIFFDEKQTKLLEFEKIKNIPPNSKKIFKAMHNMLKNSDIFEQKDDKKVLNIDKFKNILSDFYRLQKRKRGKKRHIFSLAILGQNAKYRVRRGETVQVLAGENIATKTYIVKNQLKTIPYFSKNVVPLDISDMLSCLELENATFIYDIDIDVNHIEELNYLKYTLTEASRLTLIVEFNKNKIDFNFDKIKIYDGAKDEQFKNLIEEYINSDKLKPYIGSIRNNQKGKALLLKSNENIIRLQYKADINKEKKELILKNLNIK